MIRTGDHLITSEKTADFVKSRNLRFYRAIVILATGVYVGIRFWNLATYSLWGGETFILDGIFQSWTGMFSYIINDIVHPPLFYILVKMWITLFGNTLIWLKLIPFLASIITIIPFYLLCRELNLHIREMSLAFILITVNGFLVHYAQEMRMYSLFACLSVFSLWLFVRYWNSGAGQHKDLFWLFLINLLMIYTHYYGWLVIGMEFLYIVIWNRAKLFSFSLSTFLLLLIFLPWVYLVVQAAINKGGLASNVDWIPKPTIFRLKSFYSNLNGQLPFPGSKELGLILFSIPIFLWGWNIVWKKQEREGSIVFWWLTLLVTLPVLVLFAISRLFDLSFWVDRYFIFVAIPYLLLLSISIFRIQSIWIRSVMSVFVLAWSLLAGANDLVTNRIAWENPQIGSRIHWETITRQIVQETAGNMEEIPIYALTVMTNNSRTGDWAIMTSVQFYLDSMNDNRFQLVYARDAPSLLPIAEDYFWVASFLLDVEDPNRLPGVFRNNGFRVGEIIQERKGDNWLIFFPVRRP